jgi:hypothetical protein
VELWTQREDTGPRAQTHAGFDYDAARHVVVLHGQSETWEWDGEHWVQVDDLGPSNPAGFVNVMAFDSGRGVFVWLAQNQTWERSNSGWTQMSDTGPDAFDLAYDDARRCCVTVAASGQGRLLTWEWSGTSWTTVADFGPPAAFQWATMAYDRRNKVTLLFGGTEDPSRFRSADTWTWDGRVWRHVSDIGPLGRTNPAMAYDDEHERILLFGGQGQGLAPLGDTWEWNGQRWRQLTDIGPSPRWDAAMCYDRERQRTVLFGGGVRGGRYGDTWEFYSQPER